MTGSELLSYIRTDILRDAVTPYLWSDSLIYRRLSEAQQIHARRTYSITDNTPTITTVIGTTSYTLAAGTLFVLSARISTKATELKDYTHKAIPSHLASSTGEPSIYTLDESIGLIRFYPVPEAVVTVNLRVARLPTNDVSSTQSSSQLEIPSQYHLDLAEYVAWRCLQDNDVDGQNEKAAQRHKRDWDFRVSDAKRELYRMRLGSNPNATSSWTGKRN